MLPDPWPLDPSVFRRPRNRGPTRHLYLASCGRGCGDTPESVLGALRSASSGVEVQGLHVGEAGVSYASFPSPEEAERVREGLARAGLWVVRFAEAGEATAGPRAPSSVASTTGVHVPGLELLEAFVTEAEAQELLAAIDLQPWDTGIRRRVQHYGHAFDYARLAIAEGGAAELPAFCGAILERLAGAGALGRSVDQLTVNEYLPGVGIAFHVDAHSAFEDGIAALTLGAGIVMEFRRPPPDGGGKVSVGKHHRLAPPPPSKAAQILRKNVWLPANSLLLLRGEARYAWQHGIAWRKTDAIGSGQVVPRGRRVSLTFRSARHRPCDCQWPMMCDTQNPDAHVLPTRLDGILQEWHE